MSTSTETTLPDFHGFAVMNDLEDEFTRWLAEVTGDARAEALTSMADQLDAVPDHAPSDYDRGRVDQRRMIAEELYERASQIATRSTTQNRRA